MARPLVSDDQRRARLLRAHHLAGGVAPATVTSLVSDLVALHATCAPTVYLSVWARRPQVTVDDVARELYETKTLIRQLSMRRTVFVTDRATHADAVSAVGPRVAASERTNMLRDLRRTEGISDPDEWIDIAAREVIEALADGTVASTSQLREAIPHIGTRVGVSVDRSWGGISPMAPRVMNYLSATGDVVRGPNVGTWMRSRPQWSAMSQWLGTELPRKSMHDGHVAMITRWLRAFGPGTETDIVWWLGSTKSAVRAALADSDVVEVDLESGGTGYLCADDVDDVAPVRPRGFLLPELDPTLMGWKERDFYLGEHAPRLFDRNGNGGQSAWWDGRVVGGWFIRTDGSVGVDIWEQLPRNAIRELESHASALSVWLGSDTFKPGFPAPFLKHVVS